MGEVTLYDAQCISQLLERERGSKRERRWNFPEFLDANKFHSQGYGSKGPLTRAAGGWCPLRSSTITAPPTDGSTTTVPPTEGSTSTALPLEGSTTGVPG